MHQRSFQLICQRMRGGGMYSEWAARCVVVDVVECFECSDWPIPPVVIEAYALGLCTPVPGHNSVAPTGTLLSSYLAVPTYSASNPSSPTNVPVNNSALPYCAVSFPKHVSEPELTRASSNHVYIPLRRQPTVVVWMTWHAFARIRLSYPLLSNVKGLIAIIPSSKVSHILVLSTALSPPLWAR